jgi:hypothetical protein
MPDPADIPDPPPPTWAVLRQDDNCNRFIVDTGLTRAQAERLVAEYESLGHKQFYWAQQNHE